MNSLQGKYITAEDVGVSVADMAIVREETPYVAGLDQGEAASGDPSPVTAKGVFLGLLETAKHAFGTSDLNGKTVAVQGVGHVGGHVCDYLAEAGPNWSSPISTRPLWTPFPGGPAPRLSSQTPFTMSKPIFSLPAPSAPW